VLLQSIQDLNRNLEGMQQRLVQFTDDKEPGHVDNVAVEYAGVVNKNRHILAYNIHRSPVGRCVESLCR